MQMGHLNQQQHGACSTKSREPMTDIDMSVTVGKKEKDVYTSKFSCLV